MCNPWCPMKPGCQDIYEKLLRPYGLDKPYLDDYYPEEDKKKRKAFREDLRSYCPIHDLIKIKVEEMILKHGVNHPAHKGRGLSLPSQSHCISQCQATRTGY